MDAEKILDEYPHWEAGGLQCPLILQEMLLQAAHLGRKEAECMICQGCQHGLLHLDLQADISAVQAVGPQTSKEEIRDLYYQVYKLWRLLGSPPCGLEWTEELVRDMVSSLKNHLRQKGGQPPREPEESEPADNWPLQSKTPRRRRRDTSTERDLAEMTEAHQRALAQSHLGGENRKAESVHQLDAHAHTLRVATAKGEGPRGRTGGAAGLFQRTALSIPLSTALPSWAQEPGRMKRLNCLF